MIKSIKIYPSSIGIKIGHEFDAVTQLEIKKKGRAALILTPLMDPIMIDSEEEDWFTLFSLKEAGRPLSSVMGDSGFRMERIKPNEAKKISIGIESNKLKQHGVENIFFLEDPATCYVINNGLPPRKLKRKQIMDIVLRPKKDCLLYVS